MKKEFIELYNYLLKLNLDRTTIDQILQSYHIHSYGKNENFAFPGACEDKLGFIIQGVFVMYTLLPNGSLFIKNFMSKNQFLLASFTPNTENLVGIQALTNSIILEAPYSIIQSFNDNNKDLQLLSRKRLETDYQSISNRLEMNSTLPALERYLTFREQFRSLEAWIPQHMVASYLGITPTHLSRIKSSIPNDLYS